MDQIHITMMWTWPFIRSDFLPSNKDIITAAMNNMSKDDEGYGGSSYFLLKHVLES